jgi:prepilin-type N-terminal cleavage/methylation domain-containing protein
MKTIKRILQGDGGFTLIELLAVMAIVATLAGIVSTSVSGSNETSKVAAAKQDASTTTFAVGAYFADHQAAEVLETRDVSVTALFEDEVADDVVATEQKFGNRWPEHNITEELANEGDATTSPYTNEFPTANSATNGKMVNISILGTADADGNRASISRQDLLTGYTAIDFDKLVGDDTDDNPGGYSEKAPSGAPRSPRSTGWTSTTSSGSSKRPPARVAAVRTTPGSSSYSSWRGWMPPVRLRWT